ncbi:MAG: oligosaccharide flippase family protein [Bacteriovorax sp.]|nr:oligosaccharide flippase family protein [Bacteriovorax sp.]
MNDEKQTAISHWPISILNGISALIGLVLPMFMSRIVSGNEIGKYKIMFLYLAMIPALSFSGGIENGLYYWTGLLHKAKEKVRGAWSMAIIQSVIFFIVVIIFSPIIRPWLNWSWDQYISVSIAGLTVVLASMYESILIARKKIWSGAIFSAIFNTINTITILVTIIIFKSAVMIVWAYAITMMLKIAASYYLGVKEGWVPVGLDLKEARSVLKYYFPVSTSGIFDFLMNNSDRFLLSILISPVQYAGYMFGCLSIPPLQILESSVNRVMIPQLATAIERNDKLQAAHLYRFGLEQIMLIFIPSFVGLFVFAEPIITLLFTEKYITSVPYLRFYSMWILLSGIPYDVAARASGNGKWILKNTIKMGSFSLILCSLLAWKFGPYGALIAMIITLLVQKFLGFNLMLKTYEWSLKEMIPVKSLFLYSGLAGSLGIASILLKNYFNSRLIWFAYCGIPFALVYLGTIFFLQKNLLGDLPFFQKMINYFMNKKRLLANAILNNT